MGEYAKRLPAGPPMSPLTGSYFWMWAIYDLRIGKSTDTIAYCQIALNEFLQMNPPSTRCGQEDGAIADGNLRANGQRWSPHST